MRKAGCILKKCLLAPQAMSLLEILVVVGVVALLATIVAPNAARFLSSGKEKAYKVDVGTLQLAVDAWRTTVGKNTGPLFPILQCEPLVNTGAFCANSGKGINDFSAKCIGQINAEGTPISATVTSGGQNITVFCNPYLDVRAIATEGFISNSAAVKSANIARNTTATHTSVGSYGWLVDAKGLIASMPPFTDGLYP